MISTDVPASEVARFMSLALKAKGQKVATLSLVPPMINTADPDIPLIRKKVAEAIDRAEGTAPKPSAAAQEGGQRRRCGHRRLGRLTEQRVRRQPGRRPRQRLLSRAASRISVLSGHSP